MEISPLLVLPVIAALIFAALLVAGARTVGGIVIAALTAINLTAMLGFVWFAATILYYDGLMVDELLLCLIPIALLAAATAGARALRRRGKTAAAITLLAIAGLPTIGIFGFLVYLDSNPIDWK